MAQSLHYDILSRKLFEGLQLCWQDKYIQYFVLNDTKNFRERQHLIVWHFVKFSVFKSHMLIDVVQQYHK